MNFDQLTTKHLNILKDEIGQTIISKGINNKGDAVDSLEVQGNKLLGNDYIYFLDKGRGPGKFPPVTNIREWVRSKLSVAEKEVNGVAYVIGRKIAGKFDSEEENEGTSIFTDNSKGIELDMKIETMLQGLYDELPEAMTKQLFIKKWL